MVIPAATPPVVSKKNILALLQNEKFNEKTMGSGIKRITVSVTIDTTISALNNLSRSIQCSIN